MGKSLPLRKCGLKFTGTPVKKEDIKVTSLAEVWIEITIGTKYKPSLSVTSLAEVWIEITG